MDTNAKAEIQRKLREKEQEKKLVEEKIKDIKERDEAALNEMHQALDGNLQVKHKRSTREENVS